MMIGTGICVAQQDSAFTFQGKLNDGGTAANGNYDMAFRIYDSVTGGTQIGSTVNVTECCGCERDFFGRTGFHYTFLL